MNPPSSFSKSTKAQNKTCSKIQLETKKQLYSRSPLQDLNTTIVTTSNSSSDNGSNDSSIEAPRGCLRFLLSHSSSSSSNANTPFLDKPMKTKTPKSTIITSKSSKRNGLQKPMSQFRKNSSCLYQWQSGKKYSKNASKLKISSDLDTGGNCVNIESSGSEFRSCDVNEVNLTPLSKVATGLGSDFRVDNRALVDGDEKFSDTSGNKNKTPPIQASVSPEIRTQCDSSLVSAETTPACFAAGYVMSGVTDKRKCRPRGILSVGVNNVLDFCAAKARDRFDEDDNNNKENVIGVDISSSISLLPLPTEASMHWLLSPCDEVDEDQKENSEIGSCRYGLHSPPSSLFDDEFNSDLGIVSNTRSSVSFNTNKRRSTSLCSPSGDPEFQGTLGPCHDDMVISSSPSCTASCKSAALEEERNLYVDFDQEKSPFSMNVLGSGNVIQTPQSDSNSHRCMGLLHLEAGKKHHFDSELDLVTENLHIASLSSKGYESIWDPTSSSFQYDCLATPSNSIDLSQFQKILDDQSSWMSTSTLGNVSQSQMRISWREGLVSRIFEMDEFDSCRCLSDDEEVANDYSNDQLKYCENSELNVDVGGYGILKNCFGCAEFRDFEPKIRDKGEEGPSSQVSCSCAESISTDGNGLTASGDSDWTLCYENQLFRV